MKNKNVCRREFSVQVWHPPPPIFHQQGKLYKYHLKSIQQLRLCFIFGAQTLTVSHLSHIYVYQVNILAHAGSILIYE